MDNRAIGVFDSGIGGLTVLKEIQNLLPNESIIYFGDCARIPYGTKSKQTIVKYACQDVRFLMTHNVKLIVIACNTASACSLKEIQQTFDINVIDVIKPGAYGAANATCNKKVGIIGTQTTINSQVYENAIKQNDSSIETYTAACPLFVPLVEEGWWDDEVTQKVAQRYLFPLKNTGIDTLVLGCTHYPLLTDIIRNIMGNSTTLINSGTQAAEATMDFISRNDMQRDITLKPEYKYYTSDSIDKFKNLGALFLTKPINSVEKIDIENY